MSNRLQDVDPKPARLLRLELSRHRDAGLPFEQAWDAALRVAAGGKWWQQALLWSREEWRSCYERKPPTVRASVFEQLALPSLGDGVEVRGPDDLTPAA